MPGTPPDGDAKTPRPKRPRAKKLATVGGDVRLTGDRLVVQLPENGERKSASGLLIPATAAPAPKRLSRADVKLVGPDVRAAKQGDRGLFLPAAGVAVARERQDLGQERQPRAPAGWCPAAAAAG